MNTIAATPAKLRTGAWGARIKGATVAVGDVVTITTRAGKTWDATVTQVVWSGDNVTLCATKSMDRPVRSAGGPNASRNVRGSWRTGCSCGSREDRSGDLIYRASNCRSCNHDA